MEHESEQDSSTVYGTRLSKTCSGAVVGVFKQEDKTMTRFSAHIWWI